MLQKSVPVLLTHNIRSTIAFYDCNLGFKGKNMGSFANIQNGTAEIRFELVSSKQPFYIAGCLIKTRNIEDLYSILSTKDIIYPQGKLMDVMNGRKSFTVKDNNGHLIRFEN